MNDKPTLAIIFWILLILSYLICFNIYQENMRIDQLQTDNSQMQLILKKMMR